MSWRSRWRKWKRRRALKSLLPGLRYDEHTDELVLVGVPVPRAEIGAPDDIHGRARLCDLVRARAGIEASQAVKVKWPLRFPDHMGNAFKEGWKHAAD